MALQEVLEMVFPNFLDASPIPIENGAGDDGLPKAGKNRRLSEKSRLMPHNDFNAAQRRLQ